MATHTFSASAGFGYGGKQWIARITGRLKGAATFEREFVGIKGGKRGEGCTATVDEPGLYETCDVDNKGVKDYAYAYFDGERVSIWRDRESAMDFAKHLGELELYERPSRKDPAQTVVDVRVRQALPEALSRVEFAAAACRNALEGLTPSERAAVVVALNVEV